MGYFEKEWKLNFTQCYSNGKLKYSELNNILQVTASEHAERIGFGYKQMWRVRQSWVLSRMLIEVDELPAYTQEIKIRTWIQDFTGSKSTRNFELLFNDRVIIRATSLWAVFNTKTRKADDLALSTDHLLLFPEKSSTKGQLSKLDSNMAFNNIGTHQVKLSDLDIVNHANNVKYMEWCFDSLDAQEVMNGTICSLEMNYLKELKYQDQVIIGAHQLHPNSTIFRIEKEQRIHFLMLVKRSENS